MKRKYKFICYLLLLSPLLAILPLPTIIIPVAYAWEPPPPPPPPNQDPAACLTARPKHLRTGEIVVLDGSGSSDPDGYIVKYEWEWTGDEVYDYNETPGDGKAEHTYGSNGVYEVKLRVTDNDGVTDTTTRPVYVGICNITKGTAHNTIQAAIDNAAAGNTIVVPRGRYIENINFDTEEIILTSIDPDDPEVVAATIIDGSDADTVVRFDSADADSTITGFTIRNGSGYDDGQYETYGGGIYCEDTSPTISNCIITNNNADYGGGIYCTGGSPNIVNCTISNNEALDCGGVIDCYYASPEINNCVITRNNVEWGYGGGIYCYGTGTLPTITNCTITNNSREGIYCVSGTPTITNCIVWGNDWQIYPTGLDVTYCDVEGGYDDPEPGNTNIDDDPKFLNADNPAGVDEVFGTLDDGLRVMAYSPCVDHGNDSNAPSKDIMGRGRVDVPYVDNGDAGYSDMGAYESPTVWFVDDDKAGDGSSWDNAFGDLQGALSVATDGNEIWVADGNYLPTADSNRAMSFVLKAGVDVYGGFKGTEGIRNWTVYQTTLSGDIGTPDDINDNSYHVVVGADGAILDGFTITAGNASSDAYPDYRGGGMYNYYSSPTVTNCVFEDNNAKYGGGMYNCYSSAKVSNCFFGGNNAEIVGGGMYTYTGRFSNCVFSKNSAAFGGGIYCYGASSTFVNCTIVGNTAGSDGGGMYHFSAYYCRPKLVNCIFWANSADNYPEIYNASSSKLVLSYCNVNGCGGSGEGWNTSFGIDGGGNIDSDPCFVDPCDPNGPDDIFGTLDDGLRLTADSNCIDAADGDAAPSTDILGLVRGDKVGVENTGFADPNYADIGAYETGLIVVVMCWIDESSPYGKYEFARDLANYRDVINSDKLLVVKSGCLVPPYPGDGYHHDIRDVLPKGYSPPPDISVETCGRPPTRDELIDDFNRIRDGAVPDYVCLSVDNSGSMETDTIEPHYSQTPNDNFIWWIGQNYPNTVIKRRDIDEFWNERWVDEMRIQVQSVIDGL